MSDDIDNSMQNGYNINTVDQTTSLLMKVTTFLTASACSKVLKEALLLLLFLVSNYEQKMFQIEQKMFVIPNRTKNATKGKKWKLFYVAL